MAHFFSRWSRTWLFTYDIDLAYHGDARFGRVILYLHTLKPIFLFTSFFNMIK